MNATAHMGPGVKELAEKYLDETPALLLSDSTKEPHSEFTPQDFHNPRSPQVDIQSENHRHRTVMYLAAQGHNAVEIAGITGYTDVHVRTILLQPWFKQQLARLIDEGGRPAIEHMLQKEGVATLQKLINIRDSKDTPAGTAAAVCFNLLDRYLGKPVQKTESVNTNINKTGTMTLEELKNEEERLEREEMRLRGAS